MRFVPRNISHYRLPFDLLVELQELLMHALGLTYHPKANSTF
jgi:hypothetical protein